MDRLRACVVALSLTVTGMAGARAPDGRTLVLPDAGATLTVLVDRDDDDDDGVPDFESARPSREALGDVVWVSTRPRKLETVSGTSLRLIVGGKPMTLEQSVGRRLSRFGVQGVAPGVTRLRLAGVELEVRVLDLLALDGTGASVDFARSHASLSRSLPVESTDLEALSFVVVGPAELLPRWVHVSSFKPDRSPLDTLGDLTLKPRPCPGSTPPGLACATTEPVRSAGDVVDRSHPEAFLHSVLSEVGGRLLIGVGEATAGLRVGGPRSLAGRMRGKLRVRLVRISPGGEPPVGGDDAGALAVARAELRTANALWGQCGVVFGSEPELDVAVVDPPGAHLVAIGCDLGTPASGGEVALSVDGREIRVATRAGQTPTVVAAALAEALRRAGFRATVSPNALTSPSALRSVDVTVRRKSGALASVAPLGDLATRDPTLGVCLGGVELSDGLSHFSDFDAAAGTLEERTLLRAFDDGDPTTLEILVVPAFARAGRIGESFIFGEGAAVRNAVIVDRAGVRAGARSFAVAHELGHILLDLPGHPDDYGVDRPSLLMDADATDPSVFGPRRLTLADCERAIRQSGPRAPVPLLAAWPLTSAPTRARSE
ncbi:MAG: hypothetical protein HYZ29_00670 [Myxococcales bacterium]|nr:hypothetical protein [Myxococcales bacterium]